MIWNKILILEFLSKQDENSIFEIKKKQEKSIRSLRQNAYWHWIICKYVWDFMWETNIGRHIALKTMFWLETTTDLNTAEFSELCKMIIDLFKEKYNIRIPLPREDEEMRYYEKYLFN